MHAAIFNGPYDISVSTVTDPGILLDTDAVVQVAAAGICGSDLWTYRGQSAVSPGSRIGHEFVGTVVATGSQTTNLAIGDWVVSPFRYSDGTCEFCRDGLPSSCVNGGFWGRDTTEAGQGEFVRVPQASGTLVKALADGSAPHPELVAELLALTDVMPTGTHAVTSARVGPGAAVVVIGDGAVGLCAVIAARLAGAGRIIVLGSRHAERQRLARHFGADEVIGERGDEAAEQVMEATAGRGADCVVECVGTAESFGLALAVVRPGGVVGYVGLPHGVSIDPATLFGRNITITGGLAPARHYLPGLLDKTLAGDIHPGEVFTTRIGLEDVSLGYQLMDERRTIKVMVSPEV